MNAPFLARPTLACPTDPARTTTPKARPFGAGLALAKFVALAIASGPGLAFAAPLLSGPMVGHVTESSATVWLRAEPGARIGGEVEQSSAGGSLAGNGGVATGVVRSLGDGFALVTFEGLRPSAESRARLSIRRGAGAAAPTEELVEVTFRTAPPASSTGIVRLAFGSCAKASAHPELPVYRAIAAEAPDFAIFVGDNSYFIVGGDGADWQKTSGPMGDWTSPELMLARHLETRDLRDLRDLIRSVPCYAVWDDHDYGPNNADHRFPLKHEALRLFQQVWANPSYGTPGTPGIFSSFRHGPVEVFLMDDRYYKDVERGETPAEGRPDDRAIWGAAQLEWLKAGLRSSTAPVKLIANGTQVLAETPDGEGHFQEAPAERERLFAFLREERIGGVVFLSGDRHYSEANRLNREGEPALLEFTSSPMGQGGAIAPQPKKHRTQLWALKGDSYGLVTVEVREGGEGTIRFEARGPDNSVPVLNGERRAVTVPLSELNHPRTP